jgi:hypothetical protein
MHPLQLLLINGKINDSSNYPLEIWGLDKDKQRSIYYAKPFRNIGINTFPAAKEIIGCEMALMFDLPTPRYNIINIDESKLTSYYSENEVRKFHKGYKFCSKKLDQYVGFNPHVSFGFLRDYEITGIFAFDVLMQNSDRGGFRGKPNLLINDDSLVMIDHELTLSFISDQQPSRNYENNIRNYPFYCHVLINHLKIIKEKSYIFDEFLEHLRLLNLDSLNSVFDDMDRFNIEYGERLDYFAYFEWCKNNIATIKNYLIGMIQ